MKSLWLVLLEKAIRALIDLDWNIVRSYVLSLWSDSRSGEDKRQLVATYLRDCGSLVSTWLLNAAIEVAYGQIKSELEKTK